MSTLDEKLEQTKSTASTLPRAWYKKHLVWRKHNVILRDDVGVKKISIWNPIDKKLYVWSRVLKSDGDILMERNE